MELLLAKSSLKSFTAANVGIVFLYFLFVSLCLYLASQAIINISIFRVYLARPYYYAVFQLLVLLAAGTLAYYVPFLRLLHVLALVPSPRVFVWPDIIFSALALSRMSFIWHYLFRWLERHSS